MDFTRKWMVTLLVVLLNVVGCTSSHQISGAGDGGGGPALNDVAQAYVQVVLAVGLHDPDFVDAYYGPEEWRIEVQQEAPSLEAVAAGAADLLRQVDAFELDEAADPLVAMRQGYLAAQLRSVAARVSMLQGRRISFDEEARELYDVEVPVFDEAGTKEILAELEELLPGDGELVERYQAFRDQFAVPPERLEAVFQAALDQCRDRTRRFLELPEGESFQVEYVSNEPWGAYNWYQGGFHSLIQVNTDLPLSVDRAVGLACHEGYPGHHVYNALLEQHLAQDRGWPEYSVYALYSPQSLIAEGTANYGVELAFPEDELAVFLRDELFPLAGLDPGQAERLARVQSLVSRLRPVGVEGARRYLDGELDAGEMAGFLVELGLFSPERAAKRGDFVDRYRGYVLTYSVGLDMVRTWVDAKAQSQEERWRKFGELLSTPRTPSDLVLD